MIFDGILNIPSVQAELILECLDLCKKYKEECADLGPSKPLPPLPLMMQVYKCTSIEDYLLETVKRIRARYFLIIVIKLQYNIQY